MKITKYFMLIAVLSIGFFSTTSAQGILSEDHQEQVVESVSSFMQNLNLSERDKPAFRDIMQDFFTGLIALRSIDFSMDTNKKVIKALVKGRDSRVKGLLSSDQYKVYKTHVKERQGQIKKFMKEQR